MINNDTERKNWQEECQIVGKVHGELTVELTVELCREMVALYADFIMKKRKIPLTGDGADTRYAHLLGQAGVHLVVHYPDCKRGLILMAQVSSVQSSQDKDDARTLSQQSDGPLVHFPLKKEDSKDSFDLELRLSDDDFQLQWKREEREKLKASTTR